jgi:hypothetical protein
MRLWTLHPRYLDPQGLVALWREALLARAVLRGKTKGYQHHPQLERFQSHPSPRYAINAYLAAVCAEAGSRGYSFDVSKTGPVRKVIHIAASTGQLDYEWQHLMRKLRKRSPAYFRHWRHIESWAPHPLFDVVKGPIADWERPL